MRAFAFALFVCGLTTLAQTSDPVSKPARDTNASKIFLGYLFRRPTNIQFDLYTHLCHAFITADENGNIRTNQSIPSRQLVEQAHDAKVKVILSIGGWGWDKQFAAIVKNPDAEARYTKAVLDIVDSYNYDGIDLDWEYPDTAEELPGFERLARYFRSELDRIGKSKGRPMLQTMAIAANTNTLKWLKTDLLLENFDWLNVMTYDMAGEWSPYASHHSPLYASTRTNAPQRSTELTMNYLLERGLPAHRLAVGIPLYGKGFPVSEPYTSTKDAPEYHGPRGGDYKNLVKLIQEKGWKRQWDNETKTPWLISPDKTAVIGYDDEESVALKTEWALKQGFRGVFFWEISSDLLPNGSHPLQDASRKKLNETAK